MYLVKTLSYRLNFLSCDGCVTRVVIVLVRTLYFRICCVTDVFTETVPTEQMKKVNSPSLTSCISSNHFTSVRVGGYFRFHDI